jgi:hypothetical protein
MWPPYGTRALQSSGAAHLGGLRSAAHDRPCDDGAQPFPSRRERLALVGTFADSLERHAGCTPTGFALRMRRIQHFAAGHFRTRDYLEVFLASTACSWVYTYQASRSGGGHEEDSSTTCVDFLW